MFENTKPFQLVVIGICVFLGFVGVMVFAFGGGKKDPTKDYGPQVVIWGTADAAAFNGVISDINGPNGSSINAKYVQKDEATFMGDFVNALAEGKGPDVLLLSLEDVLSNQTKLVTIPFASFSERTFQDSFIEEGELFRTHSGFLALPFSIDPLVMYWNRDMFTAKGKALPPADWSTLLSLVPLLSNVSNNLTINQSAVSLGDYRNVNHSKEIISALLFQAGNPITSLGYDEQQKKESLSLSFGDKPDNALVAPSEAVLNFYTQFANPLSKQYTWNRSLSNSLDLFVANNLAMYFGFGSEASTIRAKNPNLNFDVALFPQLKSSATPVTYGKLYGLAILSTSKNKAGALKAIINITGASFLSKYQEVSGLPPVRRDLLDTPSTKDPASPILYKSTFYSKGWLDPNPQSTSKVFQSMIESSLANGDSSNGIIQKTNNQLNLLVEEYNKKIENK